MARISDRDAANRFLRKTFPPRFNARFKVALIASGSAFVPLLTTNLDDILCLKAERTVGKDNVVSYQGHSPRIPKTADRCHYARATVVVHGYAGGDMAVFHGPRLLARYDNAGRLPGTKVAAGLSPPAVIARVCWWPWNNRSGRRRDCSRRPPTPPGIRFRTTAVHVE